MDTLLSSGADEIIFNVTRGGFPQRALFSGYTGRYTMHKEGGDLVPQTVIRTHRHQLGDLCSPNEASRSEGSQGSLQVKPDLGLSTVDWSLVDLGLVHGELVSGVSGSVYGGLVSAGSGSSPRWTGLCWSLS
ncbi:hypothetical protein EYF80_040978 [Liparis tanakae]|uniref:Uncharacterized protein n=1 Tax=Liparis tanakae TaxID=230148 RepID=A0A4Z2G7B0_9TELE|nr:hypothetical protein EYF80_040978 [Liparis tanakae]